MGRFEINYIFISDDHYFRTENFSVFTLASPPAHYLLPPDTLDIPIKGDNYLEESVLVLIAHFRDGPNITHFHVRLPPQLLIGSSWRFLRFILNSYL